MCTTECVHTLTCCTHIFLHTARSLRTSHTSRACRVHAWLKGAKKVLCTCVTSLHLVFSSPCCSLTVSSRPFFDFDVHTFLPYLAVLKAQGMRISARAARSLAIWPSPPSTQGWDTVTMGKDFLCPKDEYWNIFRTRISGQVRRVWKANKNETSSFD